MANAIYIDGQLLRDAEQILGSLGLDAETVAKMALKRVVRDGGISFLIADVARIEVPAADSGGDAPAENSPVRMKKSDAVALFRSLGFALSRNITFASKNKSGNYYWGNPVFDVLKQDWYLLLNDQIKRELHLFKVPARALKSSELVCRSDDAEKVDLQIIYGSPSFTDSRSKISFAKFLLKTVPY